MVTALNKPSVINKSCWVFIRLPSSRACSHRASDAWRKRGWWILYITLSCPTVRQTLSQGDSQCLCDKSLQECAPIWTLYFTINYSLSCGRLCFTHKHTPWSKKEFSRHWAFALEIGELHAKRANQMSKIVLELVKWMNWSQLKIIYVFTFALGPSLKTPHKLGLEFDPLKNNSLAVETFKVKFKKCQHHNDLPFCVSFLNTFLLHWRVSSFSIPVCHRELEGCVCTIAHVCLGYDKYLRCFPLFTCHQDSWGDMRNRLIWGHMT